MPTPPTARTRASRPLGPHRLGAALEARTPRQERTRRGVWFTPPDVADALVDAALARWSGRERPQVVVDPAVGGGAFLLAAHARLPEAWLRGVDIDPASVDTTRAALAQAGARHVDVRVGDGLDPAALRPPRRAGPRAVTAGRASQDRGGADVVVGNPPFLSQLSAATARDAGRRSQLRGWYGDAAGGYVDDAGLFLLATAAHVLGPDGVGVLVVPEALLATRSAAAVRREVSSRCEVEVVWRDEAGVFPGVPTCAVALTPRRRARGRGDAGTVGDGGASTGAAAVGSRPWSTLLVADDLAPAEGARRIGDVATATADFRDAYYLVADHVVEVGQSGGDDEAGWDGGAAAGVRIVPVGLIDPAHLRWGRAEVRFAKRRWSRPVAVGLPEDFLAARLGPKVLLATQTRVLEALVDADGDLLPTTPAITLRTPRPWHLAAVLTSALLTAVAHQRHAGAGMARGALRVSARQVLDLPLPAGDSTAWDDAAADVADAHRAADAAARRALLLRASAHMWAAFDRDPDPVADARWADGLPRR